MKELEEAIKYFNDNVNGGVECPCCKRYTKQYNRKLNSGMAYALILIYLISDDNDDYIHISNEFVNKGISTPIRNEYSKLRYWGLIEPKLNDGNGGTSNGYWKITTKGENFVKNEIEVKERIQLINGELHGFDGDDINIIYALNNKFDYHELMSQK